MQTELDELEVVQDVENQEAGLKVLREMRKDLGIVDVEINDPKLDEALIASMRNDDWFWLVDPCTDEILSVGLIYGSFYKSGPDNRYTPIMSLMVFTPEEHRRKGYAHRMIPEVTKRMHLNGFIVHADNQASKNLLDKLGWVCVDPHARLLNESEEMEVYLKGTN